MEPCKGEVEGPIGLFLPDRPPNKILEPQKGKLQKDPKKVIEKRKERWRKEGEVEKGRKAGRKEGRKEGRKGTVVVVALLRLSCLSNS